MSDANSNERPRQLTEKYVADLTIPGDYHEEELRAFFVRVTAKGIKTKGTKTYYVKNRVRGQSACVYVKIGRDKDTSVKDAREKAKDLLKQMSQGINPNIERAERRNQEKQQRESEQAYRDKVEAESKRMTLGEALANYIAERTTTGNQLRPSTVWDYNSVITKNLSSWLNLPLAAIDGDMVDEQFKAIESKSQANKAFRYLSAIFNWAIAEGEEVPQGNPTKRLKKKKHVIKARDRIVKESQLKRWYQAVIALEDHNARNYLRLLLFTGLRRSEALGLRWKNIDFDEKTLMVTDTKNSTNMVLPLTDTVESLLTEHRSTLEARGDLGEYVFPGRGRKGHMINPTKQITRVEEACGIPFRSHDLRRSIATIADGLQIDFFTISRLLNHKSAGGCAPTKDYINRAAATAIALRGPLQQITNHICKQIGISADSEQEVTVNE